MLRFFFLLTLGYMGGSSGILHLLCIFSFDYWERGSSIQWKFNRQSTDWPSAQIYLLQQQLVIERISLLLYSTLHYRNNMRWQNLYYLPNLENTQQRSICQMTIQGEGEDGARSAATHNMKRNICEHIGTRKHIRNTLEAFKWLKQLACLLYFRIFLITRSQLQFYRDFPSNLVRSLITLLSELYHVQKAK